MVNRFISICGLLLLLLSPLAAQSPSQGFSQLVAQGNAARHSNNIPQAIRLYQKALQFNPNWSEGWWYLGSLQYDVNACGPAIKNLSHYIQLAPQAGPPYALRGLCESQQGQYQAALRDIQQALAQGAANNPRNIAVLVLHQALLLTRLGRFEASVATYKMLISHNVRSPSVTLGLGLAGLRMPILPKNLPPAQKPLVSQVGQAAVDIMAGHRASGSRLFDQILQHHPAQPQLHYFYGYLLSRIDLNQAIAQLKDELKLSPHSAQAHAMLAWDLGVEGEYPAALPYARLAYAENPALPLSQLVMGQDLVNTGQMSAGIPYLKTLIQADPRDLDAHLELARAYSNLGQSKQARKERLLCLSIEKKGASTPDVAQ